MMFFVRIGPKVRGSFAVEGLAWEGRQTTELSAKFPLQLISPHPRHSFHTAQDGKASFVNDIEEHRVLVDGWYYWVARIDPADAAARGIRHHQLVRLHNDRGAVICAAMVTERIQPGVVHAFESSAVYAPLGVPGERAEHGGCINTLTNKRFQSAMTNASAPNSCLIENEAWDGWKKDFAAGAPNGTSSSICRSAPVAETASSR